MNRLACAAAAFVWLTAASAPAYAAADREHQQIMAEIRMLQEQQQQLQQMLGGLAETLADALKAMTAKLDDQSSSTRKASPISGCSSRACRRRRGSCARRRTIPTCGCRR
jgi:uncharacterized protein YlxW (UPF0749 family)